MQIALHAQQMWNISLHLDNLWNYQHVTDANKKSVPGGKDKWQAAKWDRLLTREFKIN